jgi:hypothetical protein
MEMYFFEHGSSEEDEKFGCAITHAHFHHLYAPNDLLPSEINNHLKEFDSVLEAWEKFGNDDYYLIGQVGSLVYGTNVIESPELKCDMYLRKQIAGKLGFPERADYLRFSEPNPDEDSLSEAVIHSHKLLKDVPRFDPGI